MNSIISAAAPLASAISIVLFALPSYIGAIRQRGFGKALMLIVALGLFGLVFESVSVKTGYPYGQFVYSDTLGYKIFGLTPWTVAFAYPPLVLGAFWLASKITKTGMRIVLTALFALALDIVLDPALTRMGIWQWAKAGPFYGVPLMNFGGWFVSGLISGWIIHKIWGKEKSVRKSLAYSAFGLTWFWAGVNLGLKQWIPGGIGVAIGLLVMLIMRIEKKREQKNA